MGGQTVLMGEGKGHRGGGGMAERRLAREGWAGYCAKDRARHFLFRDLAHQQASHRLDPFRADCNRRTRREVARNPGRDRSHGTRRDHQHDSICSMQRLQQIGCGLERVGQCDIGQVCRISMVMSYRASHVVPAAIKRHIASGGRRHRGEGRSPGTAANNGDPVIGAVLSGGVGGP